MSDTQDNRAEGGEAAAPAVAPKPAAKPVAAAKKPAAPDVAPAGDVKSREEVVTAATPPAVVAAAAAKKGEPVACLGGLKPVIDSEGRLYLSAQFFTDPHVGKYAVRRFEGDANPPYVVLPGDSGGVAFRTGVVLTGGFESFWGRAAVPGEGIVTDIETRHGELYLIIRPFGGQAATVVEGQLLAVVELEA